MAKTRTIKSTVVAVEGKASPTDATPELVRTVHGETIAASELTHIAPLLRPFAIGIDLLTRDPNNARKHDKRDLKSTAASLQRFGQRAVIVFDPRNNTIGVGNGRHEAAKSLLEWKYIAAMPFEGTPEEFRAYKLADNRTAELSTWDPEALARELDAVRDIEAELENLGELNIDAMGFSDQDMAELEEAFEDKQKKKSTAVEAKQAESVSGKFFNIVIKCGSERHQLELLEAIENRKAKELIKLLNGAELRTQN